MVTRLAAACLRLSRHHGSEVPSILRGVLPAGTVGNAGYDVAASDDGVIVIPEPWEVPRTSLADVFDGVYNDDAHILTTAVSHTHVDGTASVVGTGLPQGDVYDTLIAFPASFRPGSTYISPEPVEVPLTMDVTHTDMVSVNGDHEDIEDEEHPHTTTVREEAPATKRTVTTQTTITGDFEAKHERVVEEYRARIDHMVDINDEADMRWLYTTQAIQAFAQWGYTIHKDDEL